FGVAPHVVAEHPPGAPGEGDQATEGTDQGRLPRTVRAEQSEDLPGLDAEADAVHGRERTEPDGEPLDQEGGVARLRGRASAARLGPCIRALPGSVRHNHAHDGSPFRVSDASASPSCDVGSGGRLTSAAIPDLKTPSGSATRTLTANTWWRRSSALWTFRGMNSLSAAIWATVPAKRLPGWLSTMRCTRCPSRTRPSSVSGT